MPNSTQDNGYGDPQKDGSKKSDEAAKKGAEAGLSVLSIAAALALFENFTKHGRWRAFQGLSVQEGQFSEAVDALISTSTHEAVTRSQLAFSRSMLHNQVEGNWQGRLNALAAAYQDDVLARTATLPDQWGRTFHERASRHFQGFRSAVNGQFNRISRSVSEAESWISKLEAPIDRDALKRVMRQIEGAGLAMGDSATARTNFDRATRVIRKWALNHPGEAIPTRLVAGLRNALDSGWRMSLQAGLHTRATRLRNNLVDLTRNFSNRVFQGATLFWSQFIGREFAGGPRGVRWNLSAGHTKPDMCDVLSTEDMGLGPGVYYLGYAPFPAHVNCLCFLTPVFNIENRSGIPGASIQQNLNDLIERANNANP